LYSQVKGVVVDWVVVVGRGGRVPRVVLGAGPYQVIDEKEKESESGQVVLGNGHIAYKIVQA
jgi:hypothetical protein